MNDIDGRIQQSQSILNNQKLKDNLKKVKGIYNHSINLETNVQYDRVIRRQEERVKVLNKIKETMTQIDKQRFEKQLASQNEYMYV